MSDVVAGVQEEGKQRFQAGAFEGPLDLLLFLIKKSEINVYDIPISQITDQYLEYLKYAAKIDLDNVTDFYVMAATLLYIKSRMLLPIEADFSEEFSDPRRELVEKLIEYQKYKKLSELIAEKEHEAEWVIERSKKQRILPFVDEDGLWEKIEVWDLLKTFTVIMKGLSAEHVINLFEEVSINEKLSLIAELLETRGEFLFTDLIVRTASIMDVICAFLAILEAVKSQRICIFQNKLFGDIRIRAAEPRPEDETGKGDGIN
jgi:segregation and condensation protein A